MSRLNVPPTKSNLLALKRDLALATEGHALLEQKREIIVMELMRLLEQVRQVEAETERRRQKAYATLRMALAHNGFERMDIIAEGIRYAHQLQASTRLVAGIRLPSLNLTQGKFQSQYGFAGTDSLVDQTMLDFLSLLEILGRKAELEADVRLLARELKKTQRRVNALEHLFIPDYRDTLHYIGSSLESGELSTFFTLKRVKQRLEKANPPPSEDGAPQEDDTISEST
jgi:V/A-type H+-transporting ATPase subunit D